MNHNVLCYGYTLEILRQGKFSAERAKEQDIPLKYWNPLQKGQTIEADGITYTPEMEYVRHITVILWRMRCL